MYADTEPSIDIVSIRKPLGGHQDEVKVVHSRGLHHPVHLARSKLVDVKNGVLNREREVSERRGRREGDEGRSEIE